MKKVIIVIPIYKERPSKNELESFAQGFKILGGHPIRVLAPEGLNLQAYENVIANFQTVFIDPTWLSSVRQYNKLKISRYFYELFKDFEYLLTYELDAWVFRDELEYWCNKGYDYIGAPWFEGFGNPVSDIIIGVGNSGFSLRNIQKCLIISKRVDRFKRIRKFWFQFHLQGIFRFEQIIKRFPKLLNLRTPGNLNELLLDHLLFNDDRYWGIHIYSIFCDYKLSSFKDAAKFSFEANPIYLFKENNYSLPFGCHAWEKHEHEFWRKYILRESSEVNKQTLK